MKFLCRSLGLRENAFTLIELLTVMAVIAILAALILSIAGYANRKAASARAQSEIQALSAACESYKADNGTYPHVGLSGTGTTIPSDLINPNPAPSTPVVAFSANPVSYQNASLELYEALTGDLTDSAQPPAAGTRNYFQNMKSDMMGRGTPSAVASGTNKVLYLSDPFGNSYGYSTANNTAVASGTATGTLPGYNPTFDLWSTAAATTTGTTGTVQWIKNW